MNKIRTALVATVAATALILTGCSTNNNSTQTICVDRKTQVRYSDDRCNRNDPNMMWWYLPSNKSKPKVTQKVTEGSSQKPTSAPKPKTDAPKVDTKKSSPAPKSNSGSSSKSSGGGYRAPAPAPRAGK
ncbi:hypothetical protein SEA_WEASELS2_161 [Rhodococcus phage Weasels2]|uniref:Lipoprotein n=1 Tax=Rhodococcus phage Weasels2 TaxID=1897437 RepID=A0A1I9SAD5_9CAUD|nr:hypothetical protein FDH04_gp253 [Rhodococcus phage Weasels2]AOZ63741.1 hypothetical protein SEA_WEASELS2_161 [Rhodococcus phage Weasels2]